MKHFQIAMLVFLGTQFSLAASQQDHPKLIGGVKACLPSYLKFAKKDRHDDEKAVVAHNESGKKPVVYDAGYNVYFPGASLLHSFDGCKYEKVFKYLTDRGLKSEITFVPKSVTDEDLRLVHPKEYLDSLSSPETIAGIVEIPPLAYLPNFLLQRVLINPMKLATGGTIQATDLALKHGWAINLSGGYHHAKECQGGGFCAFADIPIAIKKLWQQNPTLKVLIVDLDAHQGNGHEHALRQEVVGQNRNPRVAIFDIYNEQIYPRDHAAKKFITFNHPVRSGITTEQYLGLLKRELPKAINGFKPDLVMYNAGTDILAGDQLGCMDVSKEGVVERDKFVFETAQKAGVPIAMVLSGGYTQESHKAISESVHGILKDRGVVLTDVPQQKPAKFWKLK